LLTRVIVNQSLAGLTAKLAAAGTCRLVQIVYAALWLFEYNDLPEALKNT
jgi:hypothetical protein